MTDKRCTAQLAVVIMAWDEAEVLPRCLDSLEPIRDRIDVVVSIDDKTADNSAEVAARYTEHVHQHAGLPVQAVEEPPGTTSQHSPNSMSRMRNDVLEAACRVTQAPMLLWLDADEWIADGHEALLEAAARCIDEDLHGIMARMVDVHASGKSWRTWENAKVIRREMRFERRRHEGVFGIERRISPAPFTIHHCKIERQEHTEQRMRQKLSEAAYLADWREFRDARAAYYLGDCLNARGAIDHAVLWLERAAKIDGPHSPQKTLALMKLVGGQFALGNGDAARAAAFEGLRVDWRRGDFFFDLSQIAAKAAANPQLPPEIRMAAEAEAEQWLKIAATYEGRAESVQEMPTEKIEDLPHMLLARAALARGEVNEAKERLELAQSYGRNRPEYHDIALACDQALAGDPLPRDREGLIVLSGGMRTGTTWFGETLNRLGRFVNEPFILGERGWYAQDGTTTAREAECSAEFAKACGELLAPLRARRGGFDEEETEALVEVYRRFADEWPEALGYKDALPQISARAFPGAQIIVLERSTASVLASISKRWGPGPVVSGIGAAYPEHWEALLPERYHNLSEDNPERGRWEQAAYNELLKWLDRKELFDAGAMFRVVQFEDLTANYHHVVPELLDWLGYQDVGAAYDRIKSQLKVPPNRPPEDVGERREFERIARTVEDAARGLPWEVAPDCYEPGPLKMVETGGG